MFKSEFVRGFNNYDVKKLSDETATQIVGESLTVQAQAEEADINVIVRRFGVTGVLPVVERPPSFGDFTEAPDFMAAQGLIVRARESFMRLAPEVRLRFQNDASRFVDFCSDEENLPEMRRMGLAVPAVTAIETPPAAVVSPPPGGAKGA